MHNKFKFKEGFLWGSATSSYQVEGGIENNDWAEAARLGKVPNAGLACNHYHLYEKDFDIIKKLNHNAYRFSIEWARIEPEEGKFNDKEIEHYKNFIKALKKRNIEPFITLWHFTLPLWFSKMGGFENQKAQFYFCRYCKYVVENLKECEVNFWATINEPLVFAGVGYLDGIWPPFKKWINPCNILKYLKVIKNLIKSHNKAYKEIKNLNPNLKLGIVYQCTFYDGGSNFIYKIFAKILNFFLNKFFLIKTKNNFDFIGLNHYFHQRISLKFERADKLFNKSLNKMQFSDMGWEIYPEAIYEVLKDLKEFNKPIYITENGIADADDSRRENYIKNYLYQVWRAMQEGVDVRGYFYWSTMDNFEWADGFNPRFGLLEINYQTMERKIRKSALEYAKICKNNILEI
jgi:beta-glucosidase